MTSKFRIFCDEPQQPTLQKDTIQPKREPLALKQHPVPRAHLKLQDPQQQHQTQSQQPLQSLHQQQRPLEQSQLQGSQHSSQDSTVAQPASSQATLSSSSSSESSSTPEDQENDISIASLGSDFVPSIVHEEFDSFECEDEANLTGHSWNSDECRHQEESFIDSDLDQHRDNILIDDDVDVGDDDFDEEAQRELSLALKKHDDSALFNCASFKDDILDYLHNLEMNSDTRPIANYMLFHQDIDSEKRFILVNWLVEVTEEYELQTETLFICIGIIDRFLSKMSISTSHFQLLGVAAMFMATKYEEIYPPELNQFVEVTDETFSGKQIIQMEQEILRTLDFRISMPTVTYFMRQIFAYNKFTRKVYNLAEYLCHLSLLEDQPFLGYYPSEIALAAVILAAHQLGAAANISTELRSSYDKSNQSQVKRRDASNSPKSDNNNSNIYKELPFCIESLRAIQESVPRTSAVYVKFSSTVHDQVALLPPLKIEDLHNCA